MDTRILIATLVSFTQKLLAATEHDERGRFTGPGGGQTGAPRLREGEKGREVTRRSDYKPLREAAPKTKTVDLTKAHQIPSKDWGYAERAHMEREFERVHGHQPSDAERKATEKAHDKKIGAK